MWLYLEIELCTALRYNEDVLWTLTQSQERTMWTEGKRVVTDHPGRERLPETRCQHTDLELTASGVRGNKFLLHKLFGLWYLATVALASHDSCPPWKMQSAYNQPQMDREDGSSMIILAGGHLSCGAEPHTWSKLPPPTSSAVFPTCSLISAMPLRDRPAN